MFPLTALSFLMMMAAIIAFFGAMHLLAASAPNNTLANAWLSLGF